MVSRFLVDLALITAGSGVFCPTSTSLGELAVGVNGRVADAGAGSVGIPVAVRLGVLVGLSVLVAIGVSVADGERVGEGVSDVVAEAVTSGGGVVAMGVCSAVEVFVAWRGALAGSSVFVGGYGVGGAEEIATRLALSQYMSLCLFANSGLVRINTVIILSWALPSTLTCPHWSIMPDIGASADQMTSGEPAFQKPVGSIPT